MNLKTATKEEMQMLKKRLGDELVKSAVQTIEKGKSRYEISGRVLWKDDWWQEINIPNEYPEMIVEVVKHAAKLYAIETLVFIYNCRPGYEKDKDGEQKIFLFAIN